MQNQLKGIYMHLKKHKIKTIFLTLVLSTLAPLIIAITPLIKHHYAHDTHDKSAIQTEEELSFTLKTALGTHANRFLIGASTSEHQCSKQCTPEICDWARFAHEHNLLKPDHQKYTCDWWHNYPSYIQQLKEKLHINTLRFSIEWALVQPEGPDSFDTNVLDHYANIFICLIEHDITPIVCFHHYTSPCWFADQGGFEKIENSSYFADYCAQTYQHIIAAVDAKINQDERFATSWHTMVAKNRHPLWATFNSPEGVAFKGYWTMEAPPALPEKRALSLVTRVLKNMMEGHVRAYKKINEAHQKLLGSTPENATNKTEENSHYNTAIDTKNTHNNRALPKPKIGFLKNITQLDPANARPLHKMCRPLTLAACAMGNNLQNECIYNFFTTGTFKATNIPALFKATHLIKPYTNKNAPHSLDWIGLNYYSNQIMHINKKIKEKDKNLQTDNANYRIYPYGLYRAIHEINDRIAQPVGEINNADQSPIPIYVTENGIATTDHDKRNRFYQEYLTMLAQAVKEGMPVYGYLTWTAFDNYEWPKTENSDENQTDNRVYGLTTVSPDGNTLTVKPGSTFFQAFSQHMTQKSPGFYSGAFLLLT